MVSPKVYHREIDENGVIRAYLKGTCSRMLEDDVAFLRNNNRILSQYQTKIPQQAKHCVTNTEEG